MIEVRKTDAFAAWFDALRDREAKLRIQVRIGGEKHGQQRDIREARALACQLEP